MTPRDRDIGIPYTTFAEAYIMQRVLAPVPTQVVCYYHAYRVQRLDTGAYWGGRVLGWLTAPRVVIQLGCELG